MLENELYEAFENLGLNDKRMLINQEIGGIYSILKKAVADKNVATKDDLYDIMRKDSELSEKQYLDVTYKRIMDLRKLIIELIS